MKKLMLIITAILILLLVVSCDKKVVESETEGMYIKPHVFSDETNKAIEYLNAELKLWDIKLSDEIKSYKIDVLFCKNGKWQKNMSHMGNLDTKDLKIGFSQRDNKYFIIETSENTEGVLDIGEVVDFSDMPIITGKDIGSKVNVEKGKEIVLYSKIGFKEGNGETITDSKDYKNSNCDTGIVILVTFSDKIVDDERGE